MPISRASNEEVSTITSFTSGKGLLGEPGRLTGSSLSRALFRSVGLYAFRSALLGFGGRRANAGSGSSLLWRRREAMRVDVGVIVRDECDAWELNGELWMGEKRFGPGLKSYLA